jgi:hypothetical protein
MKYVSTIGWPLASVNHSPVADPARAAPLVSALQTAAAEEDFASAWQDGLDLLGTLAGVKPACLLYANCSWAEPMAGFARNLGLERLDFATQYPSRFSEALPAWYVETLEGRSVLLLPRARLADARAATASPFIAPSTEARLLGYPECCVVAHQEQSLAFANLWVELARRFAGSDETRLGELARSGWLPSPRDEGERSRILDALAADLEPMTSINRCPACRAGGAQSAAAREGDALRAVAESSGYSEKKTAIGLMADRVNPCSTCIATVSS